MRALRWVLFVLVSTGIVAPSAAPAAPAPRRPHSDISIEWNGELTRARGVRSGRGTVRDPFVISGWTVGTLRIKDTDKAIRIENNTIGTLILDWIGPNVTVVRNDVGDLRVNQNNARWGAPMAGAITHNTFGTVGQLRHFDGTFAYNRVGSPQDGTLESAYPDTRAVNFDGFNGSRFFANTIYGYVDARIHGHHHSSSFDAHHSHMHGGGPMHDRDHGADHTKRYHTVTIERNSIYTSHVYALAYLDTNHAANDRTASSETNPYLNAPHKHFTRARILSNKLTGAGLLVNVFNARDERHVGTPWGTMEIAGNTVAIERDPARPFEVLNGIEVRQARSMGLTIRGNTVRGAGPIAGVEPLRRVTSNGAGLLLDGLDQSTVLVDRLTVSERRFGVQAIQLSKSVKWRIVGLKTTAVDQDVAYDGTVRNAPQRA